MLSIFEGDAKNEMLDLKIIMCPLLKRFISGALNGLFLVVVFNNKNNNKKMEQIMIKYNRT